MGDPKTHIIPDLLANTITGTAIETLTADFTGGESGNTEVYFDNIEIPTTLKRIYLFSATNESEETDITIKVYLKNTIEEDEYWTLLGEFDVVKGPDSYIPSQDNDVSGLSKLIQGTYLGDGLGISVVVKGVYSTAFSSNIWIYEAD